LTIYNNIILTLFVVNINVDDYMTLASGRLLIGAVRSRDAGRYRCSGYNDVIDARVWSPSAYRLRVVDGMSSGVTASVVDISRYTLVFTDRLRCFQFNRVANQLTKLLH